MTRLLHNGEAVGFCADGFFYDWTEYQAGNLIKKYQRNLLGNYELIKTNKTQTIKGSVPSHPVQAINEGENNQSLSREERRAERARRDRDRMVGLVST